MNLFVDIFVNCSLPQNVSCLTVGLLCFIHMKQVMIFDAYKLNGVINRPTTTTVI